MQKSVVLPKNLNSFRCLNVNIIQDAPTRQCTQITYSICDNAVCLLLSLYCQESWDYCGFKTLTHLQPLHTNISPCQHTTWLLLSSPHTHTSLTHSYLRCSVDWVLLSRFFARDTGIPAWSGPDWQQELSLLLFDWQLLSWLCCGWWLSGSSDL